MKDPINLPGSTVFVKFDQVEKALSRFKKKVQQSGKLQELREREAYTKPSIARKKARNQAKRRWQKKLEDQSIETKKY